MQKIKILFFLPFMNGGGAERVAITLLKHLDRKRYEPILVLLKKEGRYLDLIPSDVRVIDLKVTQVRYALFKMVRTIHREKPGIVFTTLAHLNLMLALVRPLLSRKIRFIARESNSVSVRNKQEKYPKLFDWLYKHVYNNFDLIVTQAHFMQNDLIANYGIKREKTVVIYNPVDSHYIQEKAAQGERATQAKTYQLIAVGKLGYQKGFDILLSIMRRVELDFHLTILGEGADKEKLEAQIKAYKLEHRVTLFGFCDNPYGMMNQADLFLLPSRYEGLPNVVLEANALGLAVVAFDAPGGTAEIIKEGFNGFLVPAFDEEAFAKAIQKASERSFDKKAIQDEIDKHFSIEKILTAYEKIFT